MRLPPEPAPADAASLDAPGPWLAVGRRAAEAGVVGPWAGRGARTVAEDAYDALALLMAARAAGCLVAAEAVAERPLAALEALRDHLPGGAIAVLGHPAHPHVAAAARRLGLPVLDEAGRAAPRIAAPAPPPDRAPLAPAPADAAPAAAAVAVAQGCLERLAAGEDLAAWIATALHATTGAGRVSVLLYDAAGRHLTVAATVGGDPSIVGRVRIPARTSLAGRAVADGRPAVGEGVREGGRGYRGTSYVILPLGGADERVGLVCLTDLVGDRAPEASTVTRWAQGIAPAASALVVAARLRRAEEESVRDPLTGLANRRAFERAMAREIERAERAGRGLGLALVDVDRFKAVNDELGHDVGDLVLVEVARRLVEPLRETDLVARWGGEEFALLLPDVESTGIDGVAQAVERVRQRVGARGIATDPGAGHGGPLRPVTVSIGLAFRTAGPEDGAGLLRRADQALLRAKAAGRDRVERG